MAFWNRKKTRDVRRFAANPHTNPKVRSAGFFSADVNRLLSGWDTQSNAIDYYLRQELTELRARSRKMVRAKHGSLLPGGGCGNSSRVGLKNSASRR